MTAVVQASFIYDDKRKDEPPEETCQIRWTKLMNVILPERMSKKVIQMYKFERNQYEIMHRNMPFMVVKPDDTVKQDTKPRFYLGEEEENSDDEDEDEKKDKV